MEGILDSFSKFLNRDTETKNPTISIIEQPIIYSCLQRTVAQFMYLSAKGISLLFADVPKYDDSKAYGLIDIKCTNRNGGLFPK